MGKKNHCSSQYSWEIILDTQDAYQYPQMKALPGPTNNQTKE